MALPFNAEFHKGTRASELARVARGVAFNAAAPRKQRDPSYKGVPPNSTGSWATPFTINHDESWKPLIPLRRQNMDMWNEENTYRYMLSRGMISGGFIRTVEGQKYFNDRLKSRGAQATKLYNPLALGRRIRKALTAPDFGKYDLAQKLERLDNQLDTVDKMTVVFDSRGTNDLIDSIRATIFSLAPTFTVSEAQNTYETLGTILQKAEALLTTAFGKDIQHLEEADNPYFDPERLEKNTRRLSAFVVSLRKLYEFMARVYGNASSTDERMRSREAVAAANALFSRTEINSSVTEAAAQLKKWQEAAMKDESRMLEDQSEADAYAEEMARQAASQEQMDVPAFEARETAAAAAAAAEAAGAPSAEAAEAANAAENPDMTESRPALPFTREEIAGMNERSLKNYVKEAILRGADSAREMAFEDGFVESAEMPEEFVGFVKQMREPQSAADAEEVDRYVNRVVRKLMPKTESAAAAAAAEAAPAAAAAAAPKLGPGSTTTERNDYIKYQYYIAGKTQTAIAAELNAMNFPITQATVSRTLAKEPKAAFRARTGY